MKFKNIFLLMIVIVFSISCKGKEIFEKPKNDFIKLNNEFALKLFYNLSKNNDENIFISPYNISTALAMTYGGAKGKTKEQMRKALLFPKDEIALHNSFQYLIQNINELGIANDDLEFKTVNAIWIDKSFEVKKKYEKLVRLKYFSEINGMNFANNPEDSRIKINDWVSENTENRINNLIPKGLITEQTRLVLTNAIYFLANWKNQFKKRYTKKTDFNLSSGEKVKVKMMHQTERFRYTENEKMQIIELPYKNDRLSMIIFLPKSTDSKNFDSLLTINIFKSIQSLQSVKIDLFLPKFKFTYFSSLNDILKEMGMRNAFTERADFSGINKNKQEKLMISNILHKAFIDVTETGTEAAAATAVIMALTSAPPSQKPITFKANHPFIFIIRDNQTRQIFFIGKLNHPKEIK